MTRHGPDWYDAQYNSRGRIPEHPAILQHWAEASAAARIQRRCVLDIPYGDDQSEKLDVFPSEHSSAPVLVYIHGGYWRALSKGAQSFIAPPFVDAGAMVVLPGYALCPVVTIEQIVLQLTRALVWVWRHAADHGGDPRRIAVAGHSAGGHLAAMMLSCRWNEVASDLPADLVRRALAISGVFDLEPLRHAPFLAGDLQLTAAAARRLSPAKMPAPAGALIAVAGGDESEEFQRQNGLIGRAWGRSAVPVCELIPGRHHMNVLHDLADPATRLHALARSMID
jgi:arylformamidase